MNLKMTASGLLSSLALTGGAAADTIVGDLTWTTGEAISVTEDLIIQGTLTVEPGVTVSVTPGAQIVVQAGGVLDVDATAAMPAVFEPASGRWDGLLFESGSGGELNHAVIRGTETQGIRIVGASPSFEHCEIADVRSAVQERDVYGVFASDNAAPTFIWSRIHDIVGPTGNDGDGGSGGTIVGPAADGNNGHVDGYNGPHGGDGGDGDDGNRGGNAVAIRLITGATASVSYCKIHDVTGGAGGAGGWGGSGSRGGNGGDGIAFVVVGDGGTGGNGGDAGEAGNGARGGHAAAVWATDPSAQVLIYQNLIHAITGGAGGKGGRGGYGAQGGSGGDGADTGITFVCGGNGGNGGHCGQDSDGGDGGDAGWANAVVIENAPARAVVSQNTIVDITPGARGDRGDRITSSAPGYGGDGGTGGWPNYCTGSDGTDRPRPNNGVNGPYGAYADGVGMMASNGSAAVQIQAVNNIFSIGSTTDAFPFATGGSAIIASDSNLYDSAYQEDFFTGSGTTSLGFAFQIGDPMFADPGVGDYRLGEGSAAIDAGDSGNVAPLGITEDLDGNARVFDDPDTPNLGLFDPIDMGAFEYTAAPGCVVDLDGNGLLNIDDIDAYVAAFLAGDLLADLDGNGLLNVDDIDVFVAAFLAGCDL